MKHRIAQLRGGQISNDSDYISIARLPDIYNEANRHVAMIPKGEGSEWERAMAMDYRSLATHYGEKEDGSNDEQAEDGEQAMSGQDDEEPTLDPRIARTILEFIDIANKKHRHVRDEEMEKIMDDDGPDSHVDNWVGESLNDNAMDVADEDNQAL